MANNVYIGAVGTVLEFDIGVQDTDVSLAHIYYKKPSGATGYWIATTVPGTTKIRYTIQANDFNESGRYSLQVYVELISGWKGRSTTAFIDVKNQFT